MDGHSKGYFQYVIGKVMFFLRNNEDTFPRKKMEKWIIVTANNEDIII